MDDAQVYYNEVYGLETYYDDEPSDAARPISISLPSDVLLPISVAREFARGILKVANEAERAQALERPEAETVTDKAEVLLDVYDSASRSLAGFDPALIDDTLTFQFNGRAETATLTRMQSFCDLDADDKPRKLTITLDVQACVG